MENSVLILKSTISTIADCDVYCDGRLLITLTHGEVEKLFIEPGQHLFEFKAMIIHNDNILDRDDFYSYKVLDLPYGQQFVFVETELMSQYEQHQNAPSACDLISEITSDPEWERLWNEYRNNHKQ